MLASRNNVNKSSVSSTKITASTSSVRQGKESFFTWFYKKCTALFGYLWGKGKSMMWIISTGILSLNLGFILLILPFSFAYLS